ncbi:hypothetical protein D3C76_1820830 [compost metagenome]
MLLVELLQVAHGIAGTGDVITGRAHVEDEACRSNTDQHQHNQTDTFLTVVRAV